MNTTQDKRWESFFNALVLIPAGLVCLGYVLYKRDFAKYGLDVSFLNFPVFVGEGLLLYGFLWMAWRYAGCQPLKINRARAVWGVYLLWLGMKTCWGYAHWGPLALRHAALFYYPLFFLVGMTFFDRRLLKPWVVRVLWSVIILVLLRRRYDYYWTLTLGCLGAVLTLAEQNRKLRWTMALILIVSIPYLLLIKTSRMMFVGNTAAVVFLLTGVWLLLRQARAVKVSIVAVIAVCFVFGFYKFFIRGDSGRTFVAPSMIFQTFRNMDQQVQREKGSYQRADLPVALYHPPNPESKSYHYSTSSVSRRGTVSPTWEISLVGETEQASRDVLAPATFLLRESLSREPLIKLVSGKEFSLSPQQETTVEPTSQTDQVPVEWLSLNNIVFRLFIWRDMFEDWKSGGYPLLGVDLGKPLRSVSLEILRWAESEWLRDGWIEPHNSFFHMFYRGGVAGVLVVMVMIIGWIRLAREAFRRRSWVLVFLAAIFLDWLVAANFLLILELPYTAIPLWLLAGMTWAWTYGNCFDTKEVNHES